MVITSRISHIYLSLNVFAITSEAIYKLEVLQCNICSNVFWTLDCILLMEIYNKLFHTDNESQFVTNLVQYGELFPNMT